MQCEALAMTQGKCMFWEFSVNILKKNSLLLGIPLHLSNKKIQHQLKANMDDHLSKKCDAVKLDNTKDLKSSVPMAWLGLAWHSFTGFKLISAAKSKADQPGLGLHLN